MTAVATPTPLPTDQPEQVLPQDILDYLIESVPDGDGSDPLRRRFRFPAAQVSTTVLHRVRTACFTLVETIAFSSFDILLNHTSKTHEQIALELAHIVLKEPVGGLGDMKRANFQLTVEGPRTVLAKDLVPMESAEGDGPSSRVTVAHPYAPIMVLVEGEKLSVIAKASTNLGRVHSRHFPVTVVRVPKRTDPDVIELVIESRGGLTPAEILQRAVDRVAELEELEE